VEEYEIKRRLISKEINKYNMRNIKNYHCLFEKMIFIFGKSVHSIILILIYNDKFITQNYRSMSNKSLNFSYKSLNSSIDEKSTLKIGNERICNLQSAIHFI